MSATGRKTAMVSLPEEMFDAFSKEAAARGVKFGMVLEERLAAPAAPAPAPPNWEAACEIMLSYLPPDHRQLIRACAKEQNRPLLDFVVGPMELVRDQGLVASITANQLNTPPTVLLSLSSTTPQAKTTCAYCGRSFVPPADRLDARFCPPPEDDQVESCGRRASLAELRRAREIRTTPKGTPVPPTSFGAPLTAPAR